MSTGTGLMQRILRAAGRLQGVRLFRHNVGLGWVGQATKRRDGSVLVRNARPLHAGLVVGGSDIIGWTSIVIRPEDVGRRVAVFTALEAKDGSGRADPDQRNFIDQVRAAGGFAGVVRSEEEALEIVGGKRETVTQLQAESATGTMPGTQQGEPCQTPGPSRRNPARSARDERPPT